MLEIKSFTEPFLVFCKLYYLNISAIKSNYIIDSVLIILFNDNDVIIIKFSMQFAHSSCVGIDLVYQ